MTESPLPRIARSAARCTLAAATALAGLAHAQDERIRVDARGRDGVRLSDARTQTTIATDRLDEGPLRATQVSADARLVVLRHGGDGDGDCITAYALDWSAAGAQVHDALAYCPRDGRLDVTLRAVPRGAVLRVASGRHLPLWHKTFLYERASGTWYEWPRLLEAGDPPDTTPSAVARTPSHADYAAWLRPLAAPD